MYGEDGETRYEKPAAPVGVRIVIVVLLLSGLALAALPLTVLLTGRHEPGRMTLENATGQRLRAVRVVRIVGTQERLVGAAHELADGTRTDVTFEPGDRLNLRIEFEADGGHRAIPLVVPAPAAGDTSTTVRIGQGFAVTVEHAGRGDGESSRAPAPADAPPPGPGSTATAAAPDDGAGHPVPDGWSEEWRPWFRHVDWVIGPDAGMAAARTSGKPMMLFYTATW